MVVDGDGRIIDITSAGVYLDSEHFFLKTVAETTQRSPRLPFMKLPTSIIEHYKVHRDFAYPALLKKVGISHSNKAEKYLLLHTNTGRPLSTAQVSKTLKPFFEFLVGSLEYVTLLALRRSYATIMYRKYLRGSVHANKPCHISFSI